MYKFFKRCLDCVLAIILIILLSPVFIVISIIMKITSPGPIYYSSKRVGIKKSIFHIIKFRTMVVDADKIGAYWTSENDPRITKIGKFLRRTSIDELPQLVNILLGDMSFIGPRPVSVQQINDYSESDLSKRCSVLPGISGMAQVNGRSSLNEEQKLYFDLLYVDQFSFITDVKILLKTVEIVLKRSGVN